METVPIVEKKISDSMIGLEKLYSVLSYGAIPNRSTDYFSRWIELKGSLIETGAK